MSYLRVNDVKREWWIDLPELTSIQLGSGVFQFRDDDSSILVMRSGDDNVKWWIDLPKLTSLIREREDSSTFYNPRSITLEGNSDLVVFTSRLTLSHHCLSWQELRFQIQEYPSYKEFHFLLLLIPRHHPRSFRLSQVSSFLHTQFATTTHFTTQYSPQPIRRFHFTQQQTPFPPSISLFGLVQSSLYDYAK